MVVAGDRYCGADDVPAYWQLSGEELEVCGVECLPVVLCRRYFVLAFLPLLTRRSIKQWPH